MLVQQPVVHDALHLQAPSAQSWPAPQVMHRAPPFPHADVDVLVTQLSLMSQQPVAQLVALHLAVGGASPPSIPVGAPTSGASVSGPKPSTETSRPSFGVSSDTSPGRASVETSKTSKERMSAVEASPPEEPPLPDCASVEPSFLLPPFPPDAFDPPSSAYWPFSKPRMSAHDTDAIASPKMTIQRRNRKKSDGCTARLQVRAIPRGAGAPLGDSLPHFPSACARAVPAIRLDVNFFFMPCYFSQLHSTPQTSRKSTFVASGGGVQRTPEEPGGALTRGDVVGDGAPGLVAMRRGLFEPRYPRGLENQAEKMASGGMYEGDASS